MAEHEKIIAEPGVITGVRVHETIPDRLLERADEIELIDLSPDELQQRLREGKVYVPDQAERAIRSYFRRGNLTALRELALRRTAERIDEQMQTYMRAHAIPGPWAAGELMMVCVSASPLSAQLVRTTRRMADRRRAGWIAVYVETPAHYQLADATRERIAQTLRLAEQLGAEVVTIPGQDVADDLIQYARSRNVTELIVGKSLRSRWDELWRGSVVHEVIRKSGNIDVYVITGEDTEQPASRRRRGQAQAPNWRGYLYGTLMVGVVSVITSFLETRLQLPNASVLFLMPVLISGLRAGLGPAIWTAILSVLVYDFFFVPPLFTFTIADSQDVLALIVFLIVAVLTSNLTVRVKAQAEAARRRESRTAALYKLSEQLARASSHDDVVQAIVTQVAEIMSAKVVVLLPEGETLAICRVAPAGDCLDESETAAATWAWQHRQPVGRGTDTLPGTDWLYVPLLTAHAAVGVLGLQFESEGATLPSDQRRLLDALAGQAAVGIERANLARDMDKARVLAETERLRSALLSSISHDLRTPLASIIGAVTSLQSYGADYDEAARRDLLSTIQEEAERLNRFVGNILDMTRLEAGALQLKRDWIEIGDIVGAAVARLERTLSEHRLAIQIEPGLPLLSLDFVLMEQVLVNLLDNAAKYSEPGTQIAVRAYRAGGSVAVEVADEGVGVPPGELEHIFDTFYRVQRQDHQGAGTGLGLSICRGFVEAHGGQIVARPGPAGRGTVFVITLPIQEVPQVEDERGNA